MVRVQEGRLLFSGPPHLRQRLLQTNQHAVVRVGWKCAHHRHGWILRTVAGEEGRPSLSYLPAVCPLTGPPSETETPCDAVTPPCQLALDSDEVTTTQLSLFN